MNTKQALYSAAAGALATALFASGYALAQDGAVNAPSAAAPAPGAPASFADIVAKVAPAVVQIDVEEKPQPVAMNGLPFGLTIPGGPDDEQGGGGSGQQGPFTFRFSAPQPSGPVEAAGSGFFVSPDGYIVTNNHVVDGASKITVHTSNDQTLTATVVGHDADTDLAVIKVTGGPFQYVSFENRAQPRVGDWVVAVGNPFGLGGTATAGIVSALGRENVSGSSYVDYMQIDAPINHGNSGGPTFDLEGHVVGVNTAIFSPSGGSVGIGFDIPADVAASVTHDLIAAGKVTRGFIGATVQTLTPELADSMGLASLKGAIVDQVSPDGPAAQAGVKSGDIIVAVNGHAVDSASAVTRQVGVAHPGDPIAVSVERNGATHDFTVRSGLRPEQISLTGAPAGGDDQAAPPSLMGLQLVPDPKGGLVVKGVDPNSDAAAKGVHEGDVILKAGAHDLASTSDLASAAAQAKAEGRKSVPLLIARGGQHVYIPIDLAPPAA